MLSKQVCTVYGNNIVQFCYQYWMGKLLFDLVILSMANVKMLTLLIINMRGLVGRSE